jgi:hypothetical protein
MLFEFFQVDLFLAIIRDDCALNQFEVARSDHASDIYCYRLFKFKYFGIKIICFSFISTLFYTVKIYRKAI